MLPAELVGPGRLELPTLRLSGVRSNHLSYGPMAAVPGILVTRSNRPASEPVWPAEAVKGGKRNEDGGIPHLIGVPIDP